MKDNFENYEKNSLSLALNLIRYWLSPIVRKKTNKIRWFALKIKFEFYSTKNFFLCFIKYCKNNKNYADIF